MTFRFHVFDVDFDLIPLHCIAFIRLIWKACNDGEKKNPSWLVRRKNDVGFAIRFAYHLNRIPQRTFSFKPRDWCLAGRQTNVLRNVMSNNRFRLSLLKLNSLHKLNKKTYQTVSGILAHIPDGVTPEAFIVVAAVVSSRNCFLTKLTRRSHKFTA